MHTFLLLADSTFRIYSVLITEAAVTAHSVGLQCLLITEQKKNVFFMWDQRFFTGVKTVFSQIQQFIYSQFVAL
jgi:hypothetical protein